MKNRYRLISRGSRGGAFYCVDISTGKSASLGVCSRKAAEQVIMAKNQADRQPSLNLQLARAYLNDSDVDWTTRTWQNVMEEIPRLKKGETRHRWLTAIKDKAFDSIRDMVVTETRSEHFMKVLQRGSLSTNVYIRRIQNFAIDMNWLPLPVLAKKVWPAIRFKEKRAITRAEHLQIVEREQNAERKAFYELAWHLGAAQSDIAFLDALNINWQNRTISFSRKKTGAVAYMLLDEAVLTVLRTLPQKGPLFPYLRKVRASDRATEFRQRCQGLNIKGITLHSYRYAWAERAKRAGYPERYAQEALGHNSKAIHRAYARNALVELPSLSEYEAKIVPFREGLLRNLESVNGGFLQILNRQVEDLLGVKKPHTELILGK